MGYSHLLISASEKIGALAQETDGLVYALNRTERSFVVQLIKRFAYILNHQKVLR